ncbi:MAG: SurA N-terminal domain-containing protein [Candidatus Omnitrophota bacterium]
MVLSILRSKKVTRRVLISILILIIPAFVLWGAGNITSGPAVVGKIGGRKVTTEDLSKSISGLRAQLLFSYYGDLEALKRIVDNRPLVNNMAWERLVLLDGAKRDKIKISDRDIALFISSHPLFRRNGVFDKAVYSYILRNNLSMEPNVFEAFMKENLMVASLRQRILVNITVADEELAESYSKNNDKVTLSYFLVDRSLFQDTLTSEENAAEEYYRTHESAFYAPYEINIGYVEFPYDGSAERRAVEEKISALYQSLSETKNDLETSAKENDLIYKTTGLFTENNIVGDITFFKAFRQAAFALIDVGNVSKPVFPDGGEKGTAYILRKIDEVPSSLRPFAQVKSEIETLLTKERSLALAEEKAAEISAAFAANTITFEDAAAQLDKAVEKAENISAGSYISNIGPARELVMLSRASSSGKILAPLKVKNGYIIARVDSITPADKASFEKDKEALRANLLSRKQVDAMEAWFQENNERAVLIGDLGKPE